MGKVEESINKVQLNGISKELNLQVVEKNYEFRREGQVVATQKCRVIEKIEFKNPSFTVEVNGQIIDVEVKGVAFGLADKRLNADGEIVENKVFDSVLTMIEKWETGQRVNVDGVLDLNEYPSFKNSEDGRIVSIPTVVTTFGASTNKATEEDSADAEITGVIYKIAHETKDDEETGRLNVELISFGYNGVAKPFNFVVESDIASDFEDFYEVGSSVKIYYEIITKQVGTVAPQTSGGFGRRNAKIVSGYKVTEYSVFRGDEPFEEDMIYYVSVEDVKKALEEREVVHMNRIKTAKEKEANKTNSSPSTPSPQGASNNPFGGAKKQNPFGGSNTSKKSNPFG